MPGGRHRAAWLEAVARIRPTEIQIYSIDRPTAQGGLLRKYQRTLDRLAEEVQARTGIPTCAF